MKFYIVDCFAQTRYQGNQLAVFVPEESISSQEMQKIANEMGFSETSFILSEKKENGGYDVRIFTPAVEVPFAGHPTLGTAYVIERFLEHEAVREVRLNLKVGQIPVYLGQEGLTMSQNQPKFGAVIEKKAAAAAVSIAPEDIRDDYPVQWVSTGLEAVIVPLKSLDALVRCHVDYDRLSQFHRDYYKCNILLFVPHGDGLRVRVFMDDPGFLEDAATGSANGNLAAYLLHHNFFGTRNFSCQVSQGSEMGRPSALKLKARITEEGYQILIGGEVCLVAEGQWS